MKNKISFVAVLILPLSGGAQTVIPQNIPCIMITQSNLPVLGSGIAGVDCIITDGNVEFDEDVDYSLKAGEYIHFGQNNVLAPDAAHQFHAYIENSMDVAWYYPNATPGTVGQFEKLELGVQFNTDITTRVNNFNEGLTGAQLNPFNPEEIDLYAEFWYWQDGAWYGPQKINGFYYDEYERGSTDWTKLSNAHQFRIRFAPRSIGLWRCKITAHVAGFGTFIASDFTFDCVDSDSKGFVSVGANGRYFRIGDEPFFPVGHNLTWPRPADGTDDQIFGFITPPSSYEAYEQQMEDLAALGGNYFRLINNPWSTDIEFEKLNDYSDRMIHAWELDNIFDKADELELHIHFDLLLQNYFDVPNAFGYFQWDWSATGDLNNNSEDNPGCVADNDPGYCYRSGLDLEDPKEFFTNANAKKYYKYKLRYIIARWGYSNEIAIIELQSEVNNTAVIHPKEFKLTGEFDTDGNPTYGCYNIEDEVYSPYKADDLAFIASIYDWQYDMCQYIKEGLFHTNHPVAVSYSGEPDIANGDLTYESPYVDVITYNHYGREVEKWYKTKDRVANYHYIGKPMMFSEYGSNDGTFECDQGSDFIKTIVLSPFTGVAGSAMNWDWQYPGEEFYWGYLGPVKNLMQGIPLDQENWTVGEYDVSDDDKVELMYLQRPQDVDGYRKAVGAVSNRTYNYWTQGIAGSDCASPVNEPANVAYLSPITVTSDDLNNEFNLDEMGSLNDYRIDWYNALTGVWVSNQFVTSGLFGNLDLNIPINQPLTGNETQPILFFELYPSSGTFKSAVNDSVVLTEKINLSPDTRIKKIDLTQWNPSISAPTAEFDEDIINIFPNPTSSFIDVNIDLVELEGFIWSLTNESGGILDQNSVRHTNFKLDLSVYPAGVYYFVLHSDGKPNYTAKIIKQ